VITQRSLFCVLVGLEGIADGSTYVAVEFSYSPLDPYAVTVTFLGSQNVVWKLSRDVLDAGLHGPAGKADVRVWSGSWPVGGMFMRLRSPDGVCLFAMPRQEVSDFLDRTYALVARGDESKYVDVDQWVSRITEQQ
jgi:Streptomyces sporulation and cell division protein, SsgA.